MALKPGSGTLPLPGVLADVVDLFGKPVEAGQEGFLIVRRPWPSMARTLWRDPERYRQQYWERIDGVYMTGAAVAEAVVVGKPHEITVVTRLAAQHDEELGATIPRTVVTSGQRQCGTPQGQTWHAAAL